MKVIAAFVLAFVSLGVSAQTCHPLGWRKVAERVISISEGRACVYEKNGVQMTIVVQGFCPFNPC